MPSDISLHACQPSSHYICILQESPQCIKIIALLLRVISVSYIDRYMYHFFIGVRQH